MESSRHLRLGVPGEGRPAPSLIYTFMARRSGGLSLGINLFPDGKDCSFDCPYCEVFPQPGGAAFDPALLREELAEFASVYAAGLPPLRDISLAGKGEPTLSLFLPEALAAAAEARRLFPAALGSASLVVITNSTGFLEAGTADLLRRYVEEEGLVVWAKLDAGTEAWYRRVNRCPIPFEKLLSGLEAFARESPVVLQTMLCALPPEGVPAGTADPAGTAGRGGATGLPEAEGPSEGELGAYAERVLSLLGAGARIRELHLYTQSRPSFEGLSAALPDAELLRLAALLRPRLPLPIRVFGSEGELEAAAR